MLLFTIVTRKTYEGVDAFVPSIKECESWARTEDEAIEALLERLAFFLDRKPGFRYELDFMRREEGERYYKLIVPDKLRVFKKRKEIRRRSRKTSFRRDRTQGCSG